VKEDAHLHTFESISASDVRLANPANCETWLVDQALELHRLISGRRSRDISNASISGEPTRPLGEKQ
jgi:hypothetical protein